MREGQGTGTDLSRALVAALAREGLDVARVRERLARRGHDLPEPVLASWVDGSAVPTDADHVVLAELEVAVGLVRGALARLLPTRQGANRPEAFDALLSADLPGETVGEDDLDRVLSHLVVDIGPDRAIARARMTQVFTAIRDGVAGVSQFIGPDPDGRSNTSELRVTTGATLGRVEDRPHGIRSAWLAFDHPLQVGESVTVSFDVFPGPGIKDRDTHYGVVAEQHMADVMVWVRFHPDEVPRRCDLEVTLDGETVVKTVDLAGATTVHHRETDFGPGICAFRWSW